MKKNDIYEEIGNISPDLIAESDPTAPIKGKKSRKFAIIAACISMLLLSVTLWLFVPYSVELPESLGLIKDNEFYDIYLKTFEFYNERKMKSLPKNNFEKYIGLEIYKYYYELHRNERPTDEFMESDSLVASAGKEDRSGTYVEVTDNQVSGIIEPDLFKRTETHLFYLSSDTKCLYSYTIDGDKSVLCGALDSFGTTMGVNDYKPVEMYLSEDGDKLYVIAYRSSMGSVIVEIDVSDPSNMYQRGGIKIDGKYVSSRINDGKLLVAYTHKMDVDLYKDFSLINDFLPEAVTVTPPFRVGSEVPFERDEIIVPDKMNNIQYLIFLQIDLQTLTVEDKLALLSFSTDVLTVFEDKILAGYQYSESENTVIDTYPTTVYREKTEIAVISYGEGGFELVDRFTLDGYLNDRYAVDLDGDVIRAVTTSENEVRNNITYERKREDIACNLWCYDVSKNKMIASVKNFAPEGEDVKSVRFDGDTAYICTAKVEIDENGNAIYFDPVYFFDLSDYKNITSIDTGTIKGYSSSLKVFGDGLLLGIGYGDDYGFDDVTLKVEIYAENGEKVESVCAYERVNVRFATSYHSYFLDSENGYIGIAFTERVGNWEWRTGYILLQFDGENLEIAAEEYFERSGAVNYSRSIVIDGYLYIMYTDEFRVINLNK